MKPSPLSLLLISTIVQSVLGQNFTGPGYLECPFVDFLDTTDSVYACFKEDNCTEAQLEACDIGESTDLFFRTYYIEFQCECVYTIGCPESCEFVTTGSPPTLPVVASVNYTGIGNVTCPLAFWIREELGDDCYPTTLDPTTCGTCNATNFEVYDIPPGATNITLPLNCECSVALNCPIVCTFVATDGATVEAPNSAPVSAPSDSMPIGSNPVAVVAAPSIIMPASSPAIVVAAPSVSMPTGSPAIGTAPSSSTIQYSGPGYLACTFVDLFELLDDLGNCVQLKNTCTTE